MKTLDKKNIRYNILSIFIYFIGIIIIIKLFTVQIVNGKDYLEKSNSRLTRETSIKASRGSILDRNGAVLAGTKIKYSLEIYKSKITEEELNKTLLNTVNILEKNLDTYNDVFPITIEPVAFKFIDSEDIANWLEKNNLSSSLSAEDVLKTYIIKYKLENFSVSDARKVISVRYRNRSIRIYKHEGICYF